MELERARWNKKGKENLKSTILHCYQSHYRIQMKFLPESVRKWDFLRLIRKQEINKMKTIKIGKRPL